MTQIFTTLILLVDTAVWAHVGHEHGGFVEGFLHPVTGLDHLLAFVAVGLWAALMGGRLLLLMPLCFAVAALVGAWQGLLHYELMMTEFVIAGSLLFFGSALFSRFKPSSWVSVGVVLVCGFFHGFAHGKEMPSTISSELYFCGFIFATLLLHLFGMGFSAFILRSLGEAKCKMIFQALGVGVFVGGILAYL